MNLTIQEAQQKVDEWIQTIGVSYYDVLTNLGILVEEQGELAQLLVRVYGQQSFKNDSPLKNNIAAQQEAIADEMADVLWVLLCLANQTGVDLNSALQKSFEKKTLRDAERHAQNEKLKK